MNQNHTPARISGEDSLDRPVEIRVQLEQTSHDKVVPAALRPAIRLVVHERRCAVNRYGHGDGGGGGSGSGGGCLSDRSRLSQTYVEGDSLGRTSNTGMG